MALRTAASWRTKGLKVTNILGTFKRLPPRLVVITQHQADWVCCNITPLKPVLSHPRTQPVHSADCRRSADYRNAHATDLSRTSGARSGKVFRVRTVEIVHVLICLWEVFAAAARSSSALSLATGLHLPFAPKWQCCFPSSVLAKLLHTSQLHVLYLY